MLVSVAAPLILMRSLYGLGKIVAAAVVVAAVCAPSWLPCQTASFATVTTAVPERVCSFRNVFPVTVVYSVPVPSAYAYDWVTVADVRPTNGFVGVQLPE